MGWGRAQRTETRDLLLRELRHSAAHALRQEHLCDAFRVDFHQVLVPNLEHLHEPNEQNPIARVDNAALIEFELSNTIQQKTRCRQVDAHSTVQRVGDGPLAEFIEHVALIEVAARRADVVRVELLGRVVDLRAYVRYTLRTSIHHLLRSDTATKSLELCSSAQRSGRTHVERELLERELVVGLRVAQEAENAVQTRADRVVRFGRLEHCPVCLRQVLLRLREAPETCSAVKCSTCGRPHVSRKWTSTWKWKSLMGGVAQRILKVD